jgi:4-O-beta-D-mannosyl-D-glucose phosphorylase
MKIKPPLSFKHALQKLSLIQEKTLRRRNRLAPEPGNRIVDCFEHPVLTPAHVPLSWRYDLNARSNPDLQERLGICGVCGAGAIEINGRFHLVCRIAGADGRSFFAIADSRSPVDGFRFREQPLLLPETGDPDLDVGDLRLTAHEDGWIYGLFRVRRDPPGATAVCGVVRTRDLLKWERLPDLRPGAGQSCELMLHPELVDGRYALYTRLPEAGGIEGVGSEIGAVLLERLDVPASGPAFPADGASAVTAEITGAPPIKTSQGWLHIGPDAGQGSQAGDGPALRAFLCDLYEPRSVVRNPGGRLIAPGPGPASAQIRCNGVIRRRNGDVFVYYASETGIRVARTHVMRLLDYVNTTPPASRHSADSVNQRIALIQRNQALGKVESPPRRSFLRRRKR